MEFRQSYNDRQLTRWWTTEKEEVFNKKIDWQEIWKGN